MPGPPRRPAVANAGRTQLVDKWNERLVRTVAVTFLDPLMMPPSAAEVGGRSLGTPAVLRLGVRARARCTVAALLSAVIVPVALVAWPRWPDVPLVALAGIVAIWAAALTAATVGWFSDTGRERVRRGNPAGFTWIKSARAGQPLFDGHAQRVDGKADRVRERDHGEERRGGDPAGLDLAQGLHRDPRFGGHLGHAARAARSTEHRAEPFAPRVLGLGQRDAHHTAIVVARLPTACGQLCAQAVEYQAEIGK
ncbi:hypothetical protein GCM10009754_47690 [Amycolatopsis minnesotensis]|uniref:Uncharacterized protein n=1 Tax=Amycolatopsis minnesotensis TaxID=337894 RepID=A0ABP5CUR1_9PSEU